MISWSSGPWVGEAWGPVYLVRSQSTGRRFAVKSILEKNLSDEAQRRGFLNELQTWIDLPEHPHIATCHFFRSVGDQVAIFAEYVDGGSLAERIKGRQPTRPDQILDAAIQMAWGLHAAHEHGVIHQDVKPGKRADHGARGRSRSPTSGWRGRGRWRGNVSALRGLNKVSWSVVAA